MKNKKQFIHRLAISLSLGLILVFSTGCATSSTRSAKPKGFLGDYSHLRKGKGSEIARVYINPEADFSKYDKVILDPVAVWRSPKTQLNKLESEELEKLVDYFYTAVYEKLSANYQIVEEPGPGVLRIRLALTEAKGSNFLFNTASTVSPVGLALSTTKKLATGSHAFVGKAAVEGEVLDSVTNTRLMAGIDERAGNKNPLGGKWGDAQRAFDFWAQRLQMRLWELSQ